jgi:membrane carboxypeptidase/penicillin-binding protein PbpC
VTEDAGEASNIASPLRSVNYSLHRKSTEDVIHLEASVAANVHSMFWFDGRALIGNVPMISANGGAMPWHPTVDGVHLIRIVDDHGRTAERDVLVQLIP